MSCHVRFSLSAVHTVVNEGPLGRKALVRVRVVQVFCIARMDSSLYIGRRLSLSPYLEFFFRPVVSPALTSQTFDAYHALHGGNLRPERLAACGDLRPGFSSMSRPSPRWQEFHSPSNSTLHFRSCPSLSKVSPPHTQLQAWHSPPPHTRVSVSYS